MVLAGLVPSVGSEKVKAFLASSQLLVVPAVLHVLCCMDASLPSGSLRSPGAAPASLCVLLVTVDKGPHLSLTESLQSGAISKLDHILSTEA